MWDVILVFLILLIGSFLQGASGFGFGLFSMGLLPLLLTLKSSTLLVLSLTVILTTFIAFRFRTYIQIKELIYIVCAALAGRVLSFFLLNLYGDFDMMKRLLGFILIGMVIYLYINNKETRTPSIDKPIFAVVIGFIGGVIGGVFAVGGPFFVFYFLMRYADKNSYNANLQASFVMMNLFTIVLHGFNGDINSNLILYIVFGIIAVLIGVNLGLTLFDRLPRDFIKKLASIIVFIAGLNLIIFG